MLLRRSVLLAQLPMVERRNDKGCFRIGVIGISAGR